MEQPESVNSSPPPSRKLERVQQLSSINVYGTFFSVGLAAANISRLFPYGGAIYAVALASVIGLSLLKADVDARKIILLGIGLSGVSFWDAIIQFFVSPVFVGFWIIPLWQIVIFSISGLMILIGVLSVIMAKS